ncbi:MAG: hypothetical protein U9N14_03610 [Pseudomonadota bacterium]|nr:hypothetical protein [Pseudomonadota bacterium]
MTEETKKAVVAAEEKKAPAKKAAPKKKESNCEKGEAIKRQIKDHSEKCMEYLKERDTHHWIFLVVGLIIGAIVS